MRMPILSYFLVAGIVLFGVLVLVSNKLEPKSLPVSQTVGVPAPSPFMLRPAMCRVNIDLKNL